MSDAPGPLFDVLDDLTEVPGPASAWPAPVPAAAPPVVHPQDLAPASPAASERGRLARLLPGARTPTSMRLARVVRIPGNPGSWADRHRYQQIGDPHSYTAALSADLAAVARPVGLIGNHTVAVTAGAVWVIEMRWQATPVSFRAGVSGHELYLDGRRERGPAAAHIGVARSMECVHGVLAQFGFDDDIDIAGALSVGGATWPNTDQLDGRVVDGVLVAAPAAVLWRLSQPGPVIVDVVAGLLEQQLVG